PITIEDDVWLAGRVSVLRGSRIGRGSVITAGSVVSGEIPSGVIAGGVPARVIRRIEGGDKAFVDWSTPAAPLTTTAPPPAMTNAAAISSSKAAPPAISASPTTMAPAP